MISSETYRIHRIIIYSFVLVFEFFGLFGNLNLIVLTVRKQSLQTNYGLILAFLATLHTVCLLYELVDMSFSIAATFFSYQIRRHSCFLALFPYIFVHSLQTGTIWVLSLDLFIAISFPLHYRNFNVPLYFIAIFGLPMVYGFTTVMLGFVLIDDVELQMCNPPSALHPSLTSKWYYFMSVFALLTVLFYSLAFGLISVKARRHSNDIRFIERKALKTLKLLIVLFLLLRLVSVCLASVLLALGIDQEIAVLVQNYNIIVGIIAYSQNAYICYFRSSEYRLLLREQLSRIHPKLAEIAPGPIEVESRKTGVSRDTVTSPI